MSQINHTNAARFRQIAEEGASVISQAKALARGSQKSEIGRLSSRFYYNLARPESGLLSEQWNNTYLELSMQSAREAHAVEPDEIKNVTQLSRSVQRFAANPPQDRDPQWTTRLGEAQQRMKTAFERKSSDLTSAHAVIPPANVLAVMSLDLAARTWHLSSKSKADGDRALAILDDTAIPTQGMILTEVANTEWAKDYSFDMNYDLGRMLLLKVDILDFREDPRANAVFAEALASMRKAAISASRTQTEAALMDIRSDPVLDGLVGERRKAVRGLFTVQ